MGELTCPDCGGQQFEKVSESGARIVVRCADCGIVHDLWKER